MLSESTEKRGSKVFFAVHHLQFGDEALESAGIVVGSDDEDVALECHEISVEALYHGRYSFGNADDGASAVFEHHFSSSAFVFLTGGRRDDDGVSVGGFG